MPQFDSERRLQKGLAFLASLFFIGPVLAKPRSVDIYQRLSVQGSRFLCNGRSNNSGGRGGRSKVKLPAVPVVITIYNIFGGKKMKDFKIIAVAVSISVIASAAIISLGFSRIARADKTVSVRGLAEKEVDADLAVWPLTFTLGNNNLAELQRDILTKTEIVKNYLSDYGITESDFTVQAPSITDNSMNPYMDRSKVNYTYIAETVILIRSSKVAEVKKAQGDSMKLMSDGIAVSQDYKSKISFEFTKLNDVKPEMIAEATKNARTAAEQFARDSGSSVGKIKRASQGLFTIEDAAAGLPEKKAIRVVTTVEYLLK